MYEGLVEILLGRDSVNPDRLENMGQTPLHRAAKDAHQEVIALLQPPEPVSPEPHESEELFPSLPLLNTNNLCPIPAMTATALQTRLS